MNNVIKKIINGTDIKQIIKNVESNIFKNGPVSITDMEILCYLYLYQKNEFNKIQDKILKFMGLNYKNIATASLPEVIFGMYSKYIKESYKHTYTPVQASIVEGINSNSCFSFSAPTSTGKSFVFRNIISESQNDVVIVVPSRALINEYFFKLCNLIKEKSVNILTFIDKINTKKANRNVFIVTPERCKELFKRKDEFNVDFFLFDEAQLSNENSFRGLFFDSIVRRAQKAYPETKFIFAHPFVENPEAQIQKNHFDQTKSKAICYSYKNVGQMFYAYDGTKFYHFGIDKKIMGKQKYLCSFDPIEQVILNGGSVLVYTTKQSIYKKMVFKTFEKYISLCTEIEDETAKKYIKQITQFIGANDNKDLDRYSQMISMLKRGIVIHHGSLPLQARVLIEKFTQAGFCKICFATSTLEQGINMPFDIVFLNTFKESEPLALKNLIGRAGRSTSIDKFDFGSIIVKSTNMSDLRNVLNKSELLDNVSMLEKEVGEDLEEFKNAILNGTLSDEYNITETQLEKIRSKESSEVLKKLLDLLFDNTQLVEITDIVKQNNNSAIFEQFIKLYELYLNRPLCKGEKNVYTTAIRILLWQIQCKSFKEICYYRYSYASKKQKRDELNEIINNDSSTALEKINAKIDLNNLYADFVTEYAEIPDKNLPVYSMFGNNETKAIDVDYDRIVFDTYDYLDKIIGFKLSDIFYASFKEYYNKTNDERASKMANLVKYRTNDKKEIWMLRYGFAFEDMEWLKPYILTIDQEEIVFSTQVSSLPSDKKAIIERFM